MYKPWACGKCGAPMSGPNDHDTTAGCNVAWPSTITTGDTSGYVTSGPTIWGSEDARRLSRYAEAVRLLTERVENCSCALPGPCDLPEIIERISNDLDNVEGYCDDCLAGVAFLAAEPKTEER